LEKLPGQVKQQNKHKATLMVEEPENGLMVTFSGYGLNSNGTGK
jgi:hypothetical protein